ncbi:MAG: nucleotide exchange factor GrpE [bacterium]|nr:nucleotide exchange factor GrpE [bacterium]
MVKDDKKQQKEEIEDLTNKWKRALADYQNLERRVAQERDDFVKFSNAGLINKILSALDSLEKAEEHLKDEGLSLAVKQLCQVLKEEGVERIEVLDREFDPNDMECVELCIGEEGKVIEEIRPGYILNNRVLRCAQVKVGQKDSKK